MKTVSSFPFQTVCAALAACWLSGCASTGRSHLPVAQAPFGKLSDGSPVTIFTMQNQNGMKVKILDYGGIVQSIEVPDRNGKLSDVVLGFDSMDGYQNNSPFFGALIGRYANRIAGGKFSLNGKEYSVSVNNSPNSLHGGFKGFDKVMWSARPMNSAKGPQLELTYVSKDGEEGFPGNLTVKAVYTLTRDNELRLDFTATTDKDTVVNLTGHSYFNLAGGGDVLGHVVTINADKFTPVNETLIPTGELRPVEGTPFDFRKPTPIGARINDDDEQLKRGRGYDHNWVVSHPAGQLGLDARVTDPVSGRVLEIFSSEPGLQFYSGNFLNGLAGKNGRQYASRGGFAMEPQRFPDSPNHPEFPSALLEPGQTYRHTIVYRFSVAR